MISGIDISRWQGIIDWDAVKSAHVPTGEAVEFAMIKAGGSDDGFYPDGQFVRNFAEARRVGLPHAMYVYLGGVESSANEIQHIKNLVASVAGLRAGEFIALDWEEHNTVEVDYLYEISKGLVDAGFPPAMIYMSLSRVKGQDWGRLVELNNGLWVAAWGNNDAVPEASEVPGSDEWPFWGIWQYSSTGNVAGIGGRVDLDQFNGDVSDFLKYGAAGPVTAPIPAPITQPTPAPDSSVEYQVIPGDNLSKIAAHYGWSWQQLWAINRDRVSNPDRIFAGMRLRVPGVTPVNPSHEYVVESGDTLSGIGAKLGMDWHIIFNNNRAVIGDNPDFIKVGQTLRY